MIFIPEKEAPAATSFGDALLRGVPRAYALLFFSGDARLGWWVLALTLFSPGIGLCGLGAAVAAVALGWVLGYDRSHLRNGFMVFNPLLVGLSVGWLDYCHAFPAPALALLWSAAVLGGFFVSAMLEAWVGWHFGLSAHSLPSVAVSYAVYLAVHHLYGAPIPPPMPLDGLLTFPFQPYEASFFKALCQSFGSIFFQSQPLPGLLLLVALALLSPLTTLVASGAFAAGLFALQTLGLPANALQMVGGFNLLLCGIALGSSYFVTSFSSVLLALLASVCTAILGVALASGLLNFHLPASALPYNAVVLVVLYALRQRLKAGGLVPSPTPGLLPESTARQVLLHSRRFPDVNTPALCVPFDEARVVTQGFSGKLTHRGKWQHALDFEVGAEGGRHTGSGAELSDYPVFNTPVLAPTGGLVVYTEAGIPDNQPGQNNPDQNWGNCVVLHAEAGWYVLLAHFKQDGVLVSAGQVVERGQLLGYCGNSGRSPVPHLHLNMQVNGFLGAPTLPFCLKHFIEEAPGERPLFRTSGVPEGGAVVRPSTSNTALRELFQGWLPGEYRYRITGEKGQSHEESLRLDFDEAGRFRLRSNRYAAHLTAFVSDGVFFCTEFSGPSQSVLAWLAAGLARVPCISDEGVGWLDQISSVPFRPQILRWLCDLGEPFFGPFLLPYRYRFGNEPGGFSVLAEAAMDHPPSQSPREVACSLQPRQGVVRVALRLCNDRTFLAELVHYQPFAS